MTLKRLAAVAVVAMGLGGGLAGCGPDATGLGLNLVPPQQVEQMGVQAWEEIRAETPPTRDAALQRRARAVTDRILVAAGYDPRAWEVVVFQGAEPNAFAVPGNRMGVFEGMMRLAASDAELAAVIGHEIVHITQGHSLERVNTAMATDAGVRLAAGAAGAAGLGDPEMLAGLFGLGAQVGVLLPYGRNQELEADALGLRYMARAGYDPRASVTLWQKMEGAPGVPTFLATHPGPADRIQRLEALIPEVMPIYEQVRRG